METKDFWRTRPVDPREIWPNEARDFTPWLFRNLHLLGEALGMDIAPVKRELPVGGFYLDILGKHVGSGKEIAIENQLQGSDHKHLGQLFTYAAGSNADTMIWVAAAFSDEHKRDPGFRDEHKWDPGFRDEHKRVIDRYNRDTPKRMEFYGVETHVVGIEDSPLYTLEFRPAACPKGWPKKRQQGDKRWPSSSEEYLKNTQLEMDYSDSKRIVKRSRRRSKNTQESRTASASLKYVAALERPNNEAWAYIFIHGNDMKASASIFDGLRKDSTRLEKILGAELFWNKRRYSRSPVISIRKVDGWASDPPKRVEETEGWMLENLSKFKDAFDPRLDKILSQR